MSQNTSEPKERYYTGAFSIAQSDKPLLDAIKIAGHNNVQSLFALQNELYAEQEKALMMFLKGLSDFLDCEPPDAA